MTTFFLWVNKMQICVWLFIWFCSSVKLCDLSPYVWLAAEWQLPGHRLMTGQESPSCWTSATANAQFPVDLCGKLPVSSPGPPIYERGSKEIYLNYRNDQDICKHSH